MFCTKRAYTERADKRTANRGAETTGKEKSITRLFIQEVKCSEERHATGQSPDCKRRRRRRKKNEKKKEKEKEKKEKKRRKNTRKDERSRQNYTFSTRSISNSPVALLWRSVDFFSLPTLSLELRLGRQIWPAPPRSRRRRRRRRRRRSRKRRRRRRRIE